MKSLEDTNSSLAGKVALVTGGSRGIGGEIVKAFARKGAIIVLNYLNSKDKAEKLAEETRSAGANVTTVRADVSKSPDVSEMFRFISEQFGRIDILVNNAGVVLPDDILSPFASLAESLWDRQIAVNLKGAYLCSKAASWMMMKNRSGKIVNMSSILALVSSSKALAYGASKAGLISLTLSFADLLAPNVQVNCLAPFYVETGFGGPMSPIFRQKMIETIPVGRMGYPAEIADVVTFLASDAPSYLTGQVIVIDGGYLLK